MIAFLIFRWAAVQEPEFYAKTFDTPPEVQEQASEEMLQRATDLRNAVDRRGRWEAVFSDEQINGWLAVDLVHNHKDALPQGVSDPRVSIAPNTLQVACRYRGEGIDGVLNLTCEITVPKPNLVAIRIRSVGVGLVPLPMHQVVETVNRAALENSLILDWQRVDGDPVAMLTISPPRDANGKRVILRTLQLVDGEVYLAGETEVNDSVHSRPRPPY